MDQKQWREIEGKCIQEEAPPCTAGCPIHVDVRAFLKEVAAGQWDSACRVLSASMPFPGIVGRICDHPCEEVCKRGEAGGAISIGALERAAVTRGGMSRRQARLSQRTERVAILGSGLSSLTAALELARKGYRVTLFESGERLGGKLWEIPEKDLPREVIREETAILEELQVDIVLSTDLDGEGRLDDLLRRFDSVYAGMDGGAGSAGSLDIKGAPEDRHSGLFTGGSTPRGGCYSPITAVSEGRKAAISIDRYIQKVSMSAGREKEGPYESKLYTSLEGIVAVGPTAMENKEHGYTGTEAREEAARCLQCECMECVKQCLFLEAFKGYPKRYVRQVSNNATMVMGSRGPTRRLVNSCSLCDLCTVICPNGLSMPQVCVEGRRNLVEQSKMPLSAHEFALDDMASANGPKAALFRHEPGKGVSRYVFFPGCQLTGILPEYIPAVYGYLRGRLEGGVGLMLRCCGVPAKWAVRDELYRGAINAVKEDWASLGRPVMIVACPTCLRTFKEDLPTVECLSLWEVMADRAEEEAGGRVGPAGRLAVHDPCTARYEAGMQDAVRSLLKRSGYTIDELPLSRTMTECCGYGGLMSAANPPLAKDVATRRASESGSDYVTYCAMCRNALAATGKRTLHVLDVLLADQKEDRAARGPCGWSQRRENRYHLTESLLENLWKEDVPGAEEHQSVLLRLSDEVRDRMEKRRILREDVQKVIHHAESGGERFVSPGEGRLLACFRPANVTYWVEYSREGEGWRVHNAYCHRMDVVRSPEHRRGNA